MQYLEDALQNLDNTFDILNTQIGQMEYQSANELIDKLNNININELLDNDSSMENTQNQLNELWAHYRDVDAFLYNQHSIILTAWRYAVFARKDYNIYNEAMKEYTKAYYCDPSTDIVEKENRIQELKRSWMQYAEAGDETDALLKARALQQNSDSLYSKLEFLVHNNIKHLERHIIQIQLNELWDLHNQIKQSINQMYNKCIEAWKIAAYTRGDFDLYNHAIDETNKAYYEEEIDEVERENIIKQAELLWKSIAEEGGETEELEKARMQQTCYDSHNAELDTILKHIRALEKKIMAF